MIWASFMTRRREQSEDWAYAYLAGALYLIVAVTYVLVAS